MMPYYEGLYQLMYNNYVVHHIYLVHNHFLFLQFSMVPYETYVMPQKQVSGAINRELFCELRTSNVGIYRCHLCIVLCPVSPSMLDHLDLQ